MAQAKMGSEQNTGVLWEGLMPTDYEKEKWVEIYTQAILELEHAKITGRIGDTRTELAARVEKLRDLPGLHVTELHAIDEARRMLLLLEGEEGQYAAEQKSRALEEALHKLRSIAPLLPRFRS